MFAALLCLALSAATPETLLADPWEAGYAGDDAAGKHVLGCWKFDPPDVGRDASSRANPARLEGAAAHAAGRFGGCLESFRGHPVQDKRAAAVVKHSPALSPRGPFTLEMWIKPKAELNEAYPDAFLLDKKYVAHADYQLILGPADRSGVRTLRACLGFGDDSATWYSRPIAWPAGQWRHIVFTYDAAGGGAFFVDGLPQGGATLPGRGAIQPGKHPLSIGDRVGSLYHGFPGYIDEVRICDGVREFRKVRFELVSDRRAYLRMERDASLRFRLTNLMRVKLPAATASFDLAGATRTSAVGGLEPGAVATLDCPLDTSLRPDRYRLAARLSVPVTPPVESRDDFDVQIVGRQPPQLPVLMWGGYGGAGELFDELTDIGFSHVLGLRCDYARIWEAKGPTEPGKPENVAEDKRSLDEALVRGLTVVASLSPGAALVKFDERLARINRKGEVHAKKPEVCGLLPGVERFCEDVGASMAAAYGRFPAFGGALIHTEVRDGAYPCFHKEDLDAYRRASGRELPADAPGRWGLDYKKLKDFPASRVVADDHPLLAYLRWYWKEGDGWNRLNTAVHRGLKPAARPGFFTFHDPAVRVAKVFGSGGDVDVVSQWTYSYPDPIRIGLATDELLAMAAGASRRQDVMKMTQIIWYRSQTAPPPKPGQPPAGYTSRWEDEQPDAPFITISPGHLREALWTKIARPIRGIMYHGWQSLVATEGAGGYRFTHPDTRHELARLIRQVVRPLGPTLLNVPPIRSDVAMLQSFAAEMFAHRGTYGWGKGWNGDAYHVALYAGLQPEILYDESILADDLAGRKLLFLCDCDVLTQKVVQRILQFQAGGGMIVGDENLCPAIKPDVVVASYARTGRAEDDKRALLAKAAELRGRLVARYTPRVVGSNPDVVPYRRQFKAADYVFIVNDARQYGRYVGHHGLVMEDGVNASTTLRFDRPAAVYDLVTNREMTTTDAGGRTSVTLELGPGDGKLLLAVASPIDDLTLAVPAVVDPGKKAALKVAVLTQGKPLAAVVPLEVTVRDPDYRVAEGSGYYAAVDGVLALDLDIATNDLPGVWQVEVRELASGRMRTEYMRVKGPKEWPPARRPIPKEMANPVQPLG